MDAVINLQKWGNSRGLRITKDLIKRGKFSDTQPLKVSFQGSSMVLTPVKSQSTLTLEAMLKGVTPEIVKDQFEWDGDMGLEIVS
jgi:antitoxin MazE